MMRRLLPIVAATFAFMSSCAIPIGGGEVGDVRVTWGFLLGNNVITQACGQVGIDDITVQLVSTDPKNVTDGVALAFGGNAACADGSLLVEDVIAGAYRMTVTGQGEVNSGIATIDVNVGANVENQLSATMILSNGEVVAAIEFRYAFPAGASCADVGVETVTAQVFNAEPLAVAGARVDCVTGLVRVEGVPITNVSVRVAALDADNNTVFLGTTQAEASALQGGETTTIGQVNFALSLTTATLRTSFDSEASCTAAGVTNIDSLLLRAEGNQNVVVDAQQIACIGDPLVIQAPPGTYTLRIDGSDANGVVLFRSEEQVTFNDAQADLGVVNLTSINSTLTVRFGFPAGESCLSLGIATLDVTTQVNNEVQGIQVPCIDGQVVFTGLSVGTATITAEAAVNGFVALSASQQVVLQPGRAANNVVVNLVAVRSQLTLDWRFQLRNLVGPQAAQAPNFDPADITTSCLDADVDVVSVRVRRGGLLIASADTACNAGQVIFQNLEIAGGNLAIEAEGLRQVEGDSIFAVPLGTTQALAGVRTNAVLTLQPTRVIVTFSWNELCTMAEDVNGAAQTVNLRIGQIFLAPNVPCAQGSLVVTLPAQANGATFDFIVQGVGVNAANNPVVENGAGLAAPVNSFTHPGTLAIRVNGPT